MPSAPGSLKCVVGCSSTRSLREPIEAALRARAGEEEVRHLHGDTLLVYTEAETAAIRDWLAPELRDGESVLVVEFERWSGRGPAPDREWLLRRGH
jgi:predicted RNA-binding Zn ribbon-like protein